MAEKLVGLFAPAGRRQSEVAQGFFQVLADPKIVERLDDLGFVTKPMTSVEFTAFVANQAQEAKR